VVPRGRRSGHGWTSKRFSRAARLGWGTTPRQNFFYVHLNRVIKKYDLDMIYVSGPGHGGPAVVGNTYLEGTYSEIGRGGERMGRSEDLHE
jgi:phosphoketolase